MACFAAGAAEVQAVDGRLQARTAEGRPLPDAALVGATLHVADERGTPRRLRVQAVEPDPRDADGELVLYELWTQAPEGRGQPFCQPDPQGRRAALVLPAGPIEGVRVTCTAGALGKCVRLGYRPWRTAADGRPMRDYLDACMRMMRADYCGDGRSHTEDGTRIDVHDRLGLLRAARPPGMAFEAAWTADGATCVARTRKPHLLSLQALAHRCPQVRTGPGCDESAPEGLAFNASRP